ncbi:MAG: hypothetical protein HW414_1887, partial [Dehalococcoidia bacterium]|nr:hypothetical protein [Dehalococcoidia bacterium]
MGPCSVIRLQDALEPGFPDSRSQQHTSSRNPRHDGGCKVLV